MSFDLSMFVYLSTIILLLNYQSLATIEVNQQQSDESLQKNEEFIATNEWQIVKEGQAIPTGLHVRLNLATGLREAKLLENTDDKSTDHGLLPVPKTVDEQEKLSKANLERAFANLDLSKDDVITDKAHEEEIRSKFRPYEELKKDFESLNMKVQTDQEILVDLVGQLTKSDNDANRKTILTDLEYYLHQYDNAILFADMNGLELLMRLLNSTSTNNDIRHLTCLTLGAAFQGNPKVQLKGMSLGFIQHLVRLLNIDNDDNIRLRLIFTLSTLMRNFPSSHSNFIEHGGIETMVKILSSQNNKLKIKVMDLMNDLILEKDYVSIDKKTTYENIHIRDELMKHGWCSHVSNHLKSISSDDFNQLEKMITILLSLKESCHNEFVSLLPILSKLDTMYRNANKNDDSIYDDILANIHKLQINLQHKLSTDL